MNQAMTFRMSNVVKKVVKSYKGQNKVTLAFTNVLENIGSFRRDKIPISTMRRMYQKNYISHALYATANSDGSIKPLTDVSLRKSDYRKHAELKVHVRSKIRKCIGNMLRKRKEKSRLLKKNLQSNR
jgi:hypothetical protein